MKNIVPILTVVAAIVVIWYAAAIPMNSQWALDQAERAEVELSTSELIFDTWSQERPRLPTPHQVVSELWGSTVEIKITSKRSLIFHGWITLSATMLGFAFGTGLGEVAGKVFRFGHLGSLTDAMALSGLGTAEMCMVDLGLDIELGSGVAAAQDVWRRRPAQSQKDAA